MTDPRRLFIELDPPAGGLQRLQQRLHATRATRRETHWRDVAAAACAVTILIATWMPGHLAQQRNQAALAQTLRDAIAPPANGIRVIDGAAIALPVRHAGVRLYLVQSNVPAPREQRD